MEEPLPTNRSRNLIRAAGVGKTFWPAVIRLEKNQHTQYPSCCCLVVILPEWGASDMRQDQMTELYAAAATGAPLTKDATTMEQDHWVVPLPGELVLARIESNAEDDSQDKVIGIACTAGSLTAVSAEAEGKLKRVQTQLLGPRETRNGTAAIEKSPGSNHPGHQGLRCYTVGASIETGTRIMGPASNVHRGSNTSGDNYLETLSDAVQTIVDVHSDAIVSVLTPEDAELLAQRGEYVNAPALGSTRNHLVGGVQVNITNVSCATAQSHGALGSAGRFHTDNGDDYCALSALTNLSDVGPDFTHGFFLLLEYGVAFEWLPFLTVLASGRMLHVSSPPQLKSGVDNRPINDWELRLMVISYPSHDVLTRAGPTVFSSHSRGALVLPETALNSISSATVNTSTNTSKNASTSTYQPRRSWATDGGSIQSNQNHVTFLARELLNWAQLTFSQVPGLSHRARIDAEQFLSSFQVLGEPATSDQSVGLAELWVPALTEENRAWVNGPWREGKAGFVPAASPDVSKLAARSKSAFMALAGQDSGATPIRISTKKQKTKSAVERRRMTMNRSQKMKVNRVLQAGSKPTIGKRKRELQVVVEPSSRVLRKQRIEGAAAAPPVVEDSSPSEIEECETCESEDEYVPLSGSAAKPHLEKSPLVPKAYPFRGIFSIESLRLAVEDARDRQAKLEKGKFSRLSAAPGMQRVHAEILSFSARLLGYDPAKLPSTNTPESSSQVAAEILGFWTNIGHLDSYLAHDWFVERRLTASAMVSHWRIWYWIEFSFREMCASALLSHDQSSWVGRLIHSAYNHVLHRSPTGTAFEREQYLALPPMPIQLHQRSLVSGYAALDAAVNIAVSLLYQWTSPPPKSDTESRKRLPATVTAQQSRFIHLILSTTRNTDILMLSSVQDAWRRLPTAVFSQRRLNNIDENTWCELETALQSTQIGHSESTIGALVCAHASICTRIPIFRDLECPVLDNFDVEVLASCSTIAGATPSLDNKWAQYSALIDHASTLGNAAPQLAMQAPIQTESFTVASNPLASETETAAAVCIADFLRDFCILHNGDGLAAEILSVRQNAWYKKIRSHTQGYNGGLDFYSPLRERAYSRRRVTSTVGPYSHDNIWTPGGIFSALVFRAITFASPKFLLRVHNNYFDSLDTWKFTVQQAKSDGLTEGDICNVRAYGTTQPKKSVQNANFYWDAANKILPEFLRIHNADSTNKVSWRKGHEFLTKDLPKQQNLLPEFGPLTTLLLCVDLVYAGVLEHPSINEFATIIWKLNLGGRKGMNKLQLIPSKASEQEFQAAFNQLYNTVGERLSPEDQESVGWDMYVLEHALCKAGRLKIV